MMKSTKAKSGNSLDDSEESPLKTFRLNISKKVIENSLEFANLGVFDEVSMIARAERLLEIFERLSPKKKDELLRYAFELEAMGDNESETQSVYAARMEGEPAHEFIVRKNIAPPLYRGKRKDGDIVSFLRTHYKEAGLLDGQLFTRATLRRLDPAADQALKNFLRTNDLPADIDLPNKKGQALDLAKGLSPEQLKAARALALKR